MNTHNFPCLVSTFPCPRGLALISTLCALREKNHLGIVQKVHWIVGVVEIVVEVGIVGVVRVVGVVGVNVEVVVVIGVVVEIVLLLLIS